MVTISLGRTGTQTSDPEGVPSRWSPCAGGRRFWKAGFPVLHLCVQRALSGRWCGLTGSPSERHPGRLALPFHSHEGNSKVGGGRRGASPRGGRRVCRGGEEAGPWEGRLGVA